MFPFRPPRTRLARCGAAIRLILLGWAAAGGAVADDTAQISFNRDVRPILSDKCFQCHGPDEGTLEGDLRLDSFAAATVQRPGYDRPAIVPGDPQAGELIRRITTGDRREVMPPPATKKSLSPDEIETLRRWIEQGAEYEGHWAFLPIESPPVPVVAKDGESEDAWAVNPIDHFILAELEAQGIRPSPEADPYTLVRRLHLDLTGLLPDAETVEQFAALHRQDPDKAVAVMADRLLRSPHHGERWGRHWLDQARYADSNGYTIDGPRTMWPYRDWVIRAIGDDLPFDRFTIEQLAGDLLPDPTKAQLVATGFHRNTLINQEGGTDNEQFRDEEVTDRVNTTGAVWLGLTLGCAQCHTHKFDPITQQEYYELFAFFNSTEDVNNTGPTVEVAEGELFLFDSDPAVTRALDEARARLARLDAGAAKAARQADWEQSRLAKSDSDSRLEADWLPLVADPDRLEAEGGAPLTVLDDGSLLAGKGGRNEVYTVEYQAPADTDTSIRAVRLRVLPDDSLPKKGPGRAANGNFVLTHFEIWQGDQQVPIDRVQADHSQPGHDVSRLIDSDEMTGWAINIGKGSAPGMKMNAPHEAHFFLADPITLPAGDSLRIVLRHNSQSNGDYNVGRFAVDVSATPPAPLHDDTPLLDALSLAADQRSNDQKQLISAAFEAEDVERKAAAAELAELERQLGYGPSARAMVMRELSTPRPTFLHKRGSFLDLDRDLGPLAPGAPAVLPALEVEDDGSPATRLDLARWLVRDDHPLTARVTVNRVWMRYFGTGLVETEDDFGTQGSYPSHPELLDWLARRFIDGGWSKRKLHRLIVTSATYRQSSHARPDLDDIDPLNRLLARQSRLRLDAEIVRDAALSASNLLSPKIGGRSVRPPQPDGIYAFTQRRQSWNTDTGPDRYRRAMYTQFFRSAPYPMLTTFDAPDFQSVCTRRPRSNTPLQALTLANSEALFELAQGLGKRLLTVDGDDAARVDAGFRWCYARQPASAEREAVLAFHRSQLEHFENNQDACAKLADSPEAAAWVTVARALMNTDEFITRE